MAMEKFLGKWKQDDKDIEGIDEFMAAAGDTDKEKLKAAKEMRSTLEYLKDGDGYKYIITDLRNGKSKEYKFKLGVEYESEDTDGRKFKVVITEDGPNRLKENYTEWTPNAIETIREVNGDTMTMTFTTTGGVSSKCTAHRM
ncbi:uncharacterized protein LOC115211594 [Argonauta hians]